MFFCIYTPLSFYQFNAAGWTSRSKKTKTNLCSQFELRLTIYIIKTLYLYIYYIIYYISIIYIISYISMIKIEIVWEMILWCNWRMIEKSISLLGWIYSKPGPCQ